MSRASRILRNVASNWVGFAVNAAVTLALTPFVLHRLGPAAYGVWILTSSVIGYYGMLDFGFRAGVTQHLTRYLANNDIARASGCLSSAAAALAGLATVMVVLSVAAAFVVPHFFQLPVDLVDETFWCIVMVGSSMSIQFALSPFAAVFTATQRFDLANLIGVATRLVGAGLIISALAMDYGLIGISAATCTINVADYAIRYFVARRLIPDVEVSRRWVNLGALKEIGAFGAWNFLISLNTYFYQYVPSLIIGFFMPVAAVGHYSLAMGLIRQINSFLAPIGAVIYPAAAAADVQGDRATLERLYHDGSRLQMLLMFSIVSLAGFWAEDFYRLWIGEAYLTGSPFHSVALLFQVLLIASITTYSTMGGQILMGAGFVKVVATALVIGSAMNVGIGLILIGKFGLLGIAIGTVVASIVIDLIVMPILLQRFLNLSIVNYVKRACLRPLCAAMIQVAVIALVRRVFTAQSWLQFFALCAVCGVACLAVIAWVGLSPEERARFLFGPLKRALSRVSKNAGSAKDAGAIHER